MSLEQVVVLRFGHLIQSVRLQQLLVENLPDHSFPEVRHVILKRNTEGDSIHYNSIYSCKYTRVKKRYLSECEAVPSRDIICVFAYKHPAVASILLLRDFLQNMIFQTSGIIVLCFNSLSKNETTLNTIKQGLTEGRRLHTVHLETSRSLPFFTLNSSFK